MSTLSKVSPISIYVIILITFPPVLGKRMITLPTHVITLSILPSRSPAARASRPAGRHGFEKCHFCHICHKCHPSA